MGAAGHPSHGLAGGLPHHHEGASRVWKGKRQNNNPKFKSKFNQIVWFTALFPYFVIITLLFKVRLEY